MLKIGYVGLDTSHVIGFTQLMNDPQHEHHVPGARVTVGWPGGSSDFEASYSRVEKFTNTLRDEYDMDILESPEAVAEACDILFIESVDGRVHLEQFKRTLPYRKPTYIDKPFALTLADACEMVALAQEHDIPLMSCSSLRYADALQNALAEGRDDILGCDFYGPMNEQATQPGLFWYGCHSVEMIVAALGTGCKEVRCVRTEDHDLLTALWQDGRVASFHGLRNVHSKFGGLLHRKDRVEWVDATSGRPLYAGLVAAILEHLPHGRSPIPAAEMIEIVAIMEAANRSREEGGSPVAVVTSVNKG